ncbi:MAG: flagellar biosynthesis anti-sigma factor FlgM [Thermodesulfobacteriota bacterium]
MKINGGGGYSPIQSLLQRIRSENEPKVSQPQESAPQQQAEKVEISRQAREIQKLEALLEELPEVREQRVEEIRAMIQEGRYRVDLEKLSDRILQALLIGDL